MDYGTDDYDLFDDQPTRFAQWALPAFIVSLLLHVGLILWLRQIPFVAWSDAPPEPPPVTFTLERVQLDPKVLEPVAAEKPKAAAAPQAVNLPSDKPALGAMSSEKTAAPAAPEIRNPLLGEKPKIEPTSYDRAVQDADRGGVKSVNTDLNRVARDLMADKPGVSGNPLLDFAPSGAEAGGSPSRRGELAGGATPGFSNLDDLLAETGPLSKETAPIRMDSDVLYGYDSYQLEPESVASLQKLGTIIQRNPQLIFSIEGHTDSFGGPDYNLQLSEYRAESVKAWLVQAMGIDPTRIATRGFGSTRLIVPTGSIEEQSLNRRVEIVLRDREAAPR